MKIISRLAYCPEKSNVRIIKIDGGLGAQENFKRFGLKLSDNVQVIKNSLSGHLFIETNAELIEMGREFSYKVIVETNNVLDCPLDKIKIGDIAIINKVKAKGEIRRRLMDMGLVKNTTIELIRKAPLGDPIEIRVNNFNLSLRLEEAETILVSPIKIKY